MVKDDELLKCYFSDDERYADLINGVSFGGKQVVRAEDLSDRDTQTGYHKNTRIKGKKNTKYRDLFRKASFGANFAVVGIENQKQVFDFIRYAENKEKLKELVKNDSAYTSMQEDAYDVIVAFTKSKELIKIREKAGEEEINMCQALKEWAEEERLEGRSEGILVGRTEGMLVNLRAIMANLNFTADKAMDVLNIPQEERVQYLSKLETI